MVRLTDRLDMTIAVDWDVKPQNNNSNKYENILHLMIHTLPKNSFRSSGSNLNNSIKCSLNFRVLIYHTLCCHFLMGLSNVTEDFIGQ